MVLEPAVMYRPLANEEPARLPSNSICSVDGQDEPGCVVPSITTGSVIVGSGEPGWMVCTPEPGIAKLILSVPGIRLAELMASRRLQ